MSNAAQIERWFCENENGDFALSSPGPLRFVGDFGQAQTLIYTTKQHCADALTARMETSVALIACYGLPSTVDLEAISRFVAGRKLLFFGDVDPPDLLIYSYLQETQDVTWSGVSQSLLAECGMRDLCRIAIKLSAAEAAAVPHLDELCPGYRKLIGDTCAEMLSTGYKISNSKV